MSDFENERDAQLIREREEYERQYFESVIEEMMESDAMDKLIAERMKYLETHLELENLEELTIYESHKGDKIDFIEDYEDLACNNLLDIIINEKADDDESLKSLIDEHVQDEKAFLDSLLIDVIQEQDLFQKAIDEMIVEHFKMEYEPERFDYEQDYWYHEPYNGPIWPYEDESIKDPFDSLGDIDYPEGYVEKDFQHELHMEFDDFDFDDDQYYESDESYEEAFVHDKTMEDEKYQNQIDNRPRDKILEYVDVDEKRNMKLIAEMEKVESIFKDYFTKDDTLDNIIKQKLRERKFNQ